MMLCVEKDCTCPHHQLLDCLQKGNHDEAMSILQNLENCTNLVDSFRSNLLHYSVKYRSGKVAQYLIDKGIDIDAKDNSGASPLMLALREPNIFMISIFLINKADIRGALLEISRYDIFCMIEFQRRAYHIAQEIVFEELNKIWSTANYGLTRSLLDADNRVKFWIVLFGKEELAEFVLKNGYSIDYQEPTRGFTALHAAIYLDKVDKAKLLIDHGADTTVMDNSGLSPVSRYITALSFQYLDNEEVLKSFLRKQISESDLVSLLKSGSRKTVETILQSDINIPSRFIENGKTLSNLLADNPHVDHIVLLDELGIGFDVNARDKRGRTPLMDAAYDNHLEKIKILLKHGANVNLKDHNENSALADAILTPLLKPDAKSIAELLLQHGADAQLVFNNGESLVQRLFQRRKVDLSRLIVAHLALLESRLTLLTRYSIQSEPTMKEYFDFCTRQLREMKDTVVHHKVTLLKLLTESDRKVLAYARNPELIRAFNRSCENMSYFYLESYYLSTLKKRIAMASNRIEIEKMAASAIEALTGICCVAYYNIMYEIIRHLNMKDLTNLCEISTL